jgi:hypothetical protein
MAHTFLKYRSVRTDDLTFEFFYDEDGNCSRVRVSYHKRTDKKNRYGYEEWDYWGFSAEPKVYLTSNHVTKIDTGYDEDFIRNWIEKLMNKAGVKPVRRFSLEQLSNRSMQQRILFPEEPRKEKLSKK